MLLRIAVHLRGRREQDSPTVALSEIEYVAEANRVDHRGLERQRHVATWGVWIGARRTRQVVVAISGELVRQRRFGYVALDEREVRVLQQPRDVPTQTRGEVVDTGDGPTVR